jgi:hypothetical protein
MNTRRGWPASPFTTLAMRAQHQGTVLMRGIDDLPYAPSLPTNLFPSLSSLKDLLPLFLNCRFIYQCEVIGLCSTSTQRYTVLIIEVARYELFFFFQKKSWF